VGEVGLDWVVNLVEAWWVAYNAGSATGEPIGAVIAVARSWASSQASRAVMRANRGRDTVPELALRSAVHALGLRYRVNIRPLREVPRTADLVFTRAKVAVFLDGCFWHGCAQHHRPAKGATAGFWNEKIAYNRRRDANTDERLRQAGWYVVRVWEHEDPQEAALSIAERVKAARSPARLEVPDSRPPTSVSG
jgi:DNA mismatch endonuclease, patch repair protein